MKNHLHILILTAVLLLLSTSISLAGQQTMGMRVTAANPCAMKQSNPCNPCNPCAKKQSNPCNPCATKQSNPCNSCNPCAKKQSNPCNPCNPCAKKQSNPCNPCNPCAKKQSNPCNPCGKRSGAGYSVDSKLVTRPAGTKLFSGASRSALAKEGKALFASSKLGTNGLACSTCHTGNAGFQSSFAQPYPHKVAMAKDRAGIKLVDADEFVQFCVVVPLKGAALAWEGRQLAALTAYVVDVKQKAYRASHSSNPCNPCAKKRANPCNPCARR